MNAGLLLAICDVSDHSAAIWTEDIGISPFPATWMHKEALSNGQELHTIALLPLKDLATVYAPAQHHIGYASAHHFFVRHDNEEINQQINWLLSNLVDHLRSDQSTGPPINRNATPSSPFRHCLQLREGPLVLNLHNKNLHLLASLTEFTDAKDLRTDIENIMHNRPLISCAHLPPSQASSITAPSSPPSVSMQNIGMRNWFGSQESNPHPSPAANGN
jgi:hypothetical protein